ncbi:MAG: arginyltransferase [Gammaproteobacteria bacterium]|nr:arginyltransferase [Gammaproteobacteria bacterium]
MNDETSLQELFRSLHFFVTPPHPCSYLSDKQATTVFLDPNADVSMIHYTHLARLGFRRSGEHIYRPECDGCDLCIPARVPVNDFKPNRSQSRCFKKNQDLILNIRDSEFDESHFQLYQRYMQNRHPGGGMDSDDPQSYEHVIRSSWSDTQLIEFFLDEHLVAVAVVDVFIDGLSAVYTFFDPEYTQRSLGVFAILSEIELARQKNLKWLYLGYWNPQSRKMAYKNQYTPLELFIDNQWNRQE